MFDVARSRHCCSCTRVRVSYVLRSCYVFIRFLYVFCAFSVGWWLVWSGAGGVQKIVSVHKIVSAQKKVCVQKIVGAQNKIAKGVQTNSGGDFGKKNAILLDAHY